MYSEVFRSPFVVKLKSRQATLHVDPEVTPQTCSLQKIKMERNVQELLDSDITEVLYTMGEFSCNYSRSNVNICFFIDSGQAFEAIRRGLQTTTGNLRMNSDTIYE